MNKILISVIGKGKYEITKYVFNGKYYEDKLVVNVLNKNIEPDEIYIIGTETSNWEYLQNCGFEYKKIIIPYGQDDKQYMDIFKALSNIDAENAELYFDVTHGFRSLPYFIFTAFNYFNEVKNSELKGCYYGMYQQEAGETPIVDLKNLIGVNDWIKAYMVFKKSGSAMDIAMLLQKYKNMFNKNVNDKDELIKNIDKLTKTLDKYSKALALNYVQDVKEQATKLYNHLTNEKILAEIKIHYPQFEIIIPLLIKDTKTVIYPDKEWKIQLEISKLYYRLFRYTNSLTVLREAVVTYLVEEKEQQIDRLYEVVYREEVERRCYREVYGKELFLILKGFADMRNASGHGGMRETGLLKLSTCQETILKQFDLVEKNLQ